jgi:ABC-2 type transport system ATP-binding protein
MYEAINLHKKYGNHHALKGLNLTVQKGEVFCLLGQNGAGKTTTINLSLGFLEPTEGKVLINGKEVKSNGSASRKSVAYIPEVVMLYSSLTAMENLDFFSRLAGYRYTTSELHSLLSDANLHKEAHSKKLSSFSKGMRQKVGIAIAVAKNADVILMDEPTSGLDPHATDEFTRIIKNLAAQGKAMLIATHDIFNAVNTGTRIGIMKEGELLHSVEATNITPDALQKLYLETI